MAAIFCNNLLTCFPILLPLFCFPDGPPDGLPCQQQTSSGVSFSATAPLASNKPHLAHPPSLFATAPWIATFSRWRSATAAPLTRRFATAPLPATNLIWRRRSPVWLAIWRTWAGFANSQHRDAAFATPDNICARSSLLQH